MANICMIAYSDYNQDARIKSYIRILVKNGYHVDLLALKDGNNRNVEEGQGYRIKRLSKKYRGSSALAYIFSYLKFTLLSSICLNWLDILNRYSAIHVHNMPNFLVFTALIQKLLGKKVILDNHDLMIPLYKSKFEESGRTFLLDLLKMEQKWSASFASHMICADHLQKEYLQKEFGIDAKKITVILNLPHEDIFKFIPVEKDSAHFNVIYHGTIAKRLGIDLMIEAVKEIRGRIPIKLHIYGVGDFLKEVVALRDRYRLQEEVFIAERVVPIEELSMIICGMDAGLIANRNTESTANFMFPVKLLEYLYLGVPVIAPRLEIIKHYFDENMLLYYESENVKELAEKIVELYRDLSLRDRIQERSYEFFKKHTLVGKTGDYLGIL